MHTHAALTIAAALIAVSVPSQASAQRGRPGFRAEAARETFRGAIPRAPEARADLHAPPLVEANRPATTTPYVRDNRWYGHAAPDDPRFRLARPFQFGRFGMTGPTHVFSIARVDLGARRVWLPGGAFEIAQWDWAATAPWCWTCDQFVVYADPDHAGWYLIYDARMGEYAHAIFLGA